MKVWAQEPRQEFHRNIGDEWRRQSLKSISPSIGAPKCPVQKGPGELVFPNLELHVCSGIRPTRMGGTQGRSRSDRVRACKRPKLNVETAKNQRRNHTVKRLGQERNPGLRANLAKKLSAATDAKMQVGEGNCHQQVPSKSKQVQSKSQVVGTHSMSQRECTRTSKVRRKKL